MVKPKIVRLKDVESFPRPGVEKDAGWLKRIVYPPNVATKGLFLIRGEINPGHANHRWHNHEKGHKFEGYEVVYPKDFEEIYHIISGSGVIQWKAEEGKTEEEKVSAGDTIFFPAGVVTHQLFNSGTEKIVMVVCGYPTHKVVQSK